MKKKYALRKVAAGLMSVAIGTQLVVGAVSAQDGAAGSENSSVASGSAESASSVASSENETNAANEKTEAEKEAEQEAARLAALVQEGKAKLTAAGIKFEEKKDAEGKTYYTFQDYTGEVMWYGAEKYGRVIDGDGKQFDNILDYLRYQTLDIVRKDKAVRAELTAAGISFKATFNNLTGKVYEFKTPTGETARVIVSMYHDENGSPNVIASYISIGTKVDGPKFDTLEEYTAWTKKQDQTSSNTTNETPATKPITPTQPTTPTPVVPQKETPATDKKEEIGTVARPTFQTEAEAKQAAEAAINGKKDVKAVIEKDAAGNWTYKVEAVQPIAQSTKEMAPKPAEKPQGKQLPETGESHVAFAAVGMFLIGLAGVVFKKFGKKA